MRLSGNPVMDLIIYRIRAMEEEHWLEAIVLTHMFVETQLRIATGLSLVRDKRNPPREEKVIEIAKQALKQNIINNQLFRKIDMFNTARNDAAHNLALGIIAYDQLEPIAKQSDDLMSELQRLYVHIEIGPEQKIN
jgi:hypothetical protein